MSVAQRTQFLHVYTPKFLTHKSARSLVCLVYLNKFSTFLFQHIFLLPGISFLIPHDSVDVASYMMSLNLLTLKKIPRADIIGRMGWEEC